MKRKFPASFILAASFFFLCLVAQQVRVSEAEGAGAVGTLTITTQDSNKKPVNASITLDGVKKSSGKKGTLEAAVSADVTHTVVFGAATGYTLVNPKNGKTSVKVGAGEKKTLAGTYKKNGDLDFKQGKAPTIDGVLSSGEWSDAGTVEIVYDSTRTIKVYYKHDASNIYVAFSNISTTDGVWPEMVIDVNNDKSSGWKSDDWWMHASHFDCEGNGAHTVWTACAADRTGWEANNDTATGIVEFRISYAHIGFTPGEGKKLGIAFEANNYTGSNNATYKLYPSTAAMDKPSTWGTAASSDGW